MHDTVKRLRLEKKLDQKEVYDAIGMDGSQYSKFERGNRPLTVQQIIDVSKFFGVTTDYIIFGVDKNSNEKTPSKQSSGEGVTKEAERAFNSDINNPAFQLILQELLVVRELLAWTLAESCKIPEKKILEKTRSIRSAFQEE